MFLFMYWKGRIVPTVYINLSNGGHTAHIIRRCAFVLTRIFTANISQSEGIIWGHLFTNQSLISNTHLIRSVQFHVRRDCPSGVEPKRQTCIPDIDHTLETISFRQICTYETENFIQLPAKFYNWVFYNLWKQIYSGTY